MGGSASHTACAMATAKAPRRVWGGAGRVTPPESRTSAADRGRRCVRRGPLLLAAGSLGAYVPELLRDKVPVWGLLPVGGVYGLNILPDSVFAGRPPGGVPWCPSLQTQGTWNAQRQMSLKPVFCQDLCLIESFSRCSHCDPPGHSTQWGLISSFILRIIRLGCANYSAKVKNFPLLLSLSCPQTTKINAALCQR